jgi:hypothetical protein
MILKNWFCKSKNLSRTFLFVAGLAAPVYSLAADPACLRAKPNAPVWQYAALPSAVTTNFTAEADLTPEDGNTSSGIGLMQGRQTYSDYAAVARAFNGYLEVWGGSGYVRTGIAAPAGVTQRIRYTVRPAEKRYDAHLIRPDGSTLLLVANAAYRNQATTGIDHWALFADAGGTARACNLGLNCTTAGVGQTWRHRALENTTPEMVVSFEASVTAAPTDAVIGLSAGGPKASFSAHSVVVRFNNRGGIDSFEGGKGYPDLNGDGQPDTAVPYRPYTTYRFRIVVSRDNFSAYVTGSDGVERTIALRYKYRTPLTGPLDTIGMIIDQGGGSVRICGVKIESPLLFQHTFRGSGQLIASEFANNSPEWVVTSGSLFRRDETGWTGVPDTCGAGQQPPVCNHSDVFRTHTRLSFSGSYTLTFRAKVNAIKSGACQHEPGDRGFKVFAGRRSEHDLYVVALSRDNTNPLYVKRKVPCGQTNSGTYVTIGIAKSYPWPMGEWRSFRIEVSRNIDDTVTITLFDGAGNVLHVATDRGGPNPATSSCTLPEKYPGATYKPIRVPLAIGFRGDCSDFQVDDVRVVAF